MNTHLDIGDQVLRHRLASYRDRLLEVVEEALDSLQVPVGPNRGPFDDLLFLHLHLLPFQTIENEVRGGEIPGTPYRSKQCQKHRTIEDEGGTTNDGWVLALAAFAGDENILARRPTAATPNGKCSGAAKTERRVARSPPELPLGSRRGCRNSVRDRRGSQWPKRKQIRSSYARPLLNDQGGRHSRPRRDGCRDDYWLDRGNQRGRSDRCLWHKDFGGRGASLRCKDRFLHHLARHVHYNTLNLGV